MKTNPNQQTLEFIRKNFYYEPDTGKLFNIKKNRFENYVSVKGYIEVKLYDSTNKDQKSYSTFAHKIIYYLVHNEWTTIDHIDGNKINNKIDNLRFATNQQNQMNKDKPKNYNATSKYKGVRWHAQANKWHARLGQKSLGLYPHEDLAALAYNEAALLAFGEYARSNKV